RTTRTTTTSCATAPRRVATRASASKRSCLSKTEQSALTSLHSEDEYGAPAARPGPFFFPPEFTVRSRSGLRRVGGAQGRTSTSGGDMHVLPVEPHEILFRSNRDELAI